MNTSQLKEFLLYIAENNKERFEQALLNMEDKDLVRTYLSLIDYAANKLSKSESTLENINEIVIND